MSDNIKRIDIKEFRESGYLQELNRKFLHPLGLALEVVVGENGNERLGGIWDYRDDEEGIHYDIKNSDPERISRFKEHENFANSEAEKRLNRRIDLLGFDIEPIP